MWRRSSSPRRIRGSWNRPPHIRVRHICAGRVSAAPEPEAPDPACHDACRCRPPRSTPALRSASGSSFAQNAQNPTKRIDVDLVATRTRLLEPNSISMTPDLFRRPLIVGRDGLGASEVDGVAASTSIGSKIEPSIVAGPAVRASLRHVKSRLCATPCRRAISLTTAPGINVSSTIRAFSSLLQRRRRSIPRTFPSISA